MSRVESVLSETELNRIKKFLSRTYVFSDEPFKIESIFIPLKYFYSTHGSSRLPGKAISSTSVQSRFPEMDLVKLTAQATCEITDSN